MKLQNKTELRKQIKHGFDSTRSLDKLHVYQDGDWDFLSCNSDITHSPQYYWVSCLNQIRQNSGEQRNINNKDITEFFQDIEAETY